MSGRRDKLSIIIPAAGMGRRMKSYGPKPLIQLNNTQTVIGRQQDILLREYPGAEIVVVVGHEADSVMGKVAMPRVKVVENERYETTNVVRSVSMGLRAASHNSVLIVYGDLVFNRQAIGIAGGHSVVVVDSRGQMRDEEVGLTVVDGRVTNFSYNLETKWGQIAYLTGWEAILFRRVVKNRDYGRWFGFEALNMVIGLGGRIRAVEPRGMRLAEIDSSRDIERARLI